MQFLETSLEGAFIIELDEKKDERGFFARMFCEKEFADHGLPFRSVQANISYNKLKGTLRGLHMQRAPFEEDKLIRCSRGAIYDVIVDMRRDSQNFHKWFGLELTADNHKMLYVPKGFAHGFITLEDETEVFYLMSEYYKAGTEEGFRWNDPAFDIKWPTEPVIMSERDKTFPLLDRAFN